MCLVLCQNWLNDASPPCLWIQPCYNNTLVPHIHLPVISVLSWNPTLWGTTHWHLTLESSTHCHVHGSCPVNPSRPQANPSSSDIYIVHAPPFSWGRREEGPESASTSPVLTQCSVSTWANHLPPVLLLRLPVLCLLLPLKWWALPWHRVGSQGGAKAVCLLEDS